MTVTAGGASAALIAGVSAAWAPYAAPFVFAAVYFLLSWANGEEKARVTKAINDAMTYYPSGDFNEPTSLSEKTAKDRLFDDSLAAYNQGHPGAYYTTVVGGEPGNMYTGELMVTPPHSGGDIKSLIDAYEEYNEGYEEYLGNPLEEPITQELLDQLSRNQKLHDEFLASVRNSVVRKNLDYFFLSSELPAINEREFYSFDAGLSTSGNALVNYYRYNTLGYLENEIKRISGGKLDAIRPMVINGVPQYRYINTGEEIVDLTQPLSPLNGPIVVSQATYSDLRIKDAKISVRAQVSYLDNTEGIDSSSLDLSEITRYKAKINLTEKDFAYDISLVTIDVWKIVMVEVIEDNKYHEIRYWIPTYEIVDSLTVELSPNDYKLEEGTLYFYDSLEKLVFGSEENFNSIWNGEDGFLFTVNINFPIIIPDTKTEISGSSTIILDTTSNDYARTSLAQTTQHAINDYFNLYTVAATNAMSQAELDFTIEVTFWSTLISSAILLPISIYAQASRAAMLGAKVALPTLALKQLAALSISPIAEIIEEVYVDSFIEAWIEGQVAINGGDERLARFLSMLVTSLREASNTGLDMVIGAFSADPAQDLQTQRTELEQDAKFSWKSLLSTDTVVGLTIAALSFASGNMAFGMGFLGGVFTDTLGIPVEEFTRIQSARQNLHKVDSQIDRQTYEQNIIQDLMLQMRVQPSTAPIIDSKNPTVGKASTTSSVILTPTQSYFNLESNLETLRFKYDMVTAQQSLIKGISELRTRNLEQDIETEAFSVTEESSEIFKDDPVYTDEDGVIHWVMPVKKFNPLTGEIYASWRSFTAEDGKIKEGRPVMVSKDVTLDTFIELLNLKSGQVPMYLDQVFSPGSKIGSKTLRGDMPLREVFDLIGYTRSVKSLLRQYHGTETGIVIVDQATLNDQSIANGISVSKTPDWGAFSDENPSKLESLFLGLNDNDKKLLRTFEHVALLTLKRNPQNFYDLFATPEAKDKTLTIVRNLDYFIDQQFKFNDFDLGTFDSTNEFLQRKWISSTRDMNPTASQDTELKRAAEELFTKEILPLLSQDKINSKKHVKRALMINTLLKIFDLNAGIVSDKRVVHELDKFDDILDSLLVHSRNAKIVSNAEFFADLYPKSVLSCFLHMVSLIQEAPFSPRLIDSGIILELDSVLDFLGRQHLLNIQDGLSLNHIIRKLTPSIVRSVKDKFLGDYSIMNIPSKLKYFDVLGLRFYQKPLDGKSVELVIESNEAKNFLDDAKAIIPKRFKNDFFAVLSQISYHILGSSTSDTLYSMEHTTVRLNHLSPVMNTRLKNFETFSDYIMSLYGNGMSMSEVSWKDKISKRDSDIINEFENVNNELGYDDFHNLDGFKRKFIEKYGQATLLDSIDSYYGVLVDDSGNLKYGLVYDGSIGFYAPSNEKVSRSNLRQAGIKTLHAQFDDAGNLDGAHSIMYRIKDGQIEHAIISLNNYKDMQMFLNMEKVTWQLGFLKRSEGTEITYKVIPSAMITDINGNLLYGRIGFDNNEIVDFGADWSKQDRIQSRIQILSNGDQEYGIKLICMSISRFGDNYRISRFNAEFINPFLKNGVEFSYFPVRFKEFKGIKRSNKKDLSTNNFIEYDYFATLEDLERVRDFKSGVFSLVRSMTSPYSSPVLVYINDDILSMLGSTILGSGEIKLGPNKIELEFLFRRLFGTDNDRLTRICRIYKNIDYRSSDTPRFLGLKPTGSQTTKQWFIELRDALKDFASNYASNPPSSSDLKYFIPSMEGRLYAYITQNIDWNSIKFSEDKEFNKNDLKSAMIVSNIMISIFGSFSFEKMLTGQIQMTDGEISFVAYPRKTLKDILKNVGLTLSEGRSLAIRMQSYRKNKLINIDYSFLTDYFLTRKYINLPVDSSLNIDIRAQQLIIPEVSEYFYAPHFKNPTDLTQKEYSLYQRLLSEYLLKDFQEWNLALMALNTFLFGDFPFKLNDYYDSSLIGELIGQGIQVVEFEVVAIDKNREDRIIWLTQGTERRGFTHILTRHGENGEPGHRFIDYFDISGDAQTIGNFIFNAIKNYPIHLKIPGRNPGAQIYVYQIRRSGNTNYLKIVVDDEGEIVTAYPDEYEN